MKKLYFSLSLLTTLMLSANIWADDAHKDYLCFTANTAGSQVKLEAIGYPYSVSLQYSTDTTSWTNYTIGSFITLPNVGSAVYFKSTARKNFSRDSNNYYHFVMTGSLAASGSVLSLLNPEWTPDEMESDIPAPGTSSSAPTHLLCFYKLFSGCSQLTSAPVLDATILVPFCYRSMFEGCTGLTSAPALPATTFIFKNSSITLPALYCYAEMFKGCTGLINAPELPATTLGIGCYIYMFEGCTNLVQAPVLPATKVELDCYKGMFANCAKLSYIKCLATDISVKDCTSDWVTGVASTGTFIKTASMTSWTTGVNGIPTGWTVENDGPATELDALDKPNEQGIHKTLIDGRICIIRGDKMYDLQGALVK